MEFIKISEVNYLYPDNKKAALKNINISIRQGEMTLIMGDSGSGKSTLGKLITGAVPNFYGGSISGRVYLQGTDLNALERSKRARKITMVFQDPEKQLMMNKVHREIALGLENLNIDPRDINRRVWEAMEFIGISDLAYRDINNLSGGEKQKVSIAAAVAYQPECIIFDEPTSQLDPSACQDIANIIQRINDELGITVIVIEQRAASWFFKADSIIYMEKGSVKLKASPKECYESFENIHLPEELKIAKCLGIKNLPNNTKEIRQKLTEMKQKPETLEIKLEKTDKSINIKNLCVSIEKDILKDLNLSIGLGSFFGIIGSNGAGKSTLLKNICGLLKYKGSIKIFDKEVKTMKLKDISSLIGYVSQNPNDYITKDSVFEEIKFTLDNYGKFEEEAVISIMESLNLMHLSKRNPRDLSGGEKQRLAIASVLVTKPKILILDEPTRGMDGKSKKQLGELLLKINNEGTTIIMVTHDMDFAAEYCNEYAMIFAGRVAAVGNIYDVMNNNIYYTSTLNKLTRGIKEGLFLTSQLGDII